MVQRALDAKGRRLEDWPGYTFEDRQSVEMRAIMGKLLSFQRCRYQVANLDNRQPEHAYFLIQHKVQLENMYISKVQVFNGETTHESPCIIAHVSQADASVTGDVRTVRVHTARVML